MGDSVTRRKSNASIEARLAALEFDKTIYTNGSAAGASLNNGVTFGAPTGNSLTLPAGIYELKGKFAGDNNGSSPGYNAWGYSLYAEQGTNTSTPPAALNPAFVRYVNDIDTFSLFVNFTSPNTRYSHASSAYIIVYQPTTIYLVPQINVTTGTNARIFAYISARRVG